MVVRTLGHFLIAAHFWYGCYYDWNYVKIPVSIKDMGDSIFNTNKLKFLTYWDALLQSVFFTLCFLNDIVGTNDNFPKKTPVVRKIKDTVLPALAFPLSMFVGVTFWGLYLIDRELIFPRVLDAYFPSWLNHLMHTNIMIFSLLELITSYRKYPSRKVGLSILILFMATYLFWIHYIHSYTNTWVYPILDVLNMPARIVFFALGLVLSVSFYIVGEKINNVRWRRTTKSKKN